MTLIKLPLVRAIVDYGLVFIGLIGKTKLLICRTHNRIYPIPHPSPHSTPSHHKRIQLRTRRAHIVSIRVVHGSDGPAGRVGSGRVTILPDFDGSGRVGSAFWIFLVFFTDYFLVPESI